MLLPSPVATPVLPLALVPSLIAILCGVAVRQRPHPALRLLGLGALAAAAGLPLSMAPVATSGPGHVLGVALDLLAAGCAWQATARILGGRPPLPWLAAAPVAWLAAATLPFVDAGQRRSIVALALGGVPFALALAALLRTPRRAAAHGGLIVLGVLHLCCLGLAAASAAADALLPAELLGCVVLWPGLGMLLIAEAALLREQSQALHDELSGVLNRRGFWRAAEAIERRSILLFDIDHFKRINDTFGHAAGDVVIRRFARIATAILGDRAIFGRIGGEEFAAALDGATVAGARRYAEEVRTAFAAAEREAGALTTVSVGLSMAGGQSLGDQVALADRALYRAKRLGRNRTVLHVGDGIDPLPAGKQAEGEHGPPTPPAAVRRRALRDSR